MAGAAYVGIGAATGTGTAVVTKPAGAAADAEPSTLTFRATSGTPIRAMVMRFSGIDGSNPIYAAPAWGGTSGTNDATSHVAPTTAWAAGDMAVFSCGCRPTGTWTARATGPQWGWTPSSGSQAELMGYQAFTSGTASGTRASTYSASARYMSCSMTLNGVASGTGVEILLAHVYADSSGALADMTAPSGWTELSSRTNQNSLSAIHGKVFYKIVVVAATEPTWAPSTTATGGSVTWSADFTKSDVVAAGYKSDGSQRQYNDSSLETNANDPIMPWPMKVELAPWSSPIGVGASVCRVGDLTRRNEKVPNVATWKNGSEYYVGFSIAVDPDYDRTSVHGEYQTIWQLRPGNFTGSPPVSLEIGQGSTNLWATGGNARPGASPDSQYAWERDLGMHIDECTWYGIIVYVGVWPNAGSGRFCVWDARTDTQLLDIIPPCGTNWPAGVGAGSGGVEDDGSAFPKDGTYHHGTTRGGTIRMREHRQGTSYLAVKPLLGSSREWRTEAAALGMS